MQYNFSFILNMDCFTPL